MKQKTEPPVSQYIPVRHPSPPAQLKRQTPLSEPIEVLGRHGNTGQKYHKGAR
jgi:hypothetical protein